MVLLVVALPCSARFLGPVLAVVDDALCPLALGLRDLLQGVRRGRGTHWQQGGLDSVPEFVSYEGEISWRSVGESEPGNGALSVVYNKSFGICHLHQHINCRCFLARVASTLAGC